MEVNIAYMDPMGNTWIHTPQKMIVENEPPMFVWSKHIANVLNVWNIWLHECLKFMVNVCIPYIRRIWKIWQHFDDNTPRVDPILTQWKMMALNFKPPTYMVYNP